MLYGADNKPMCDSHGMPVCNDSIPFSSISLTITDNVGIMFDFCLSLHAYVSGLSPMDNGYLTLYYDYDVDAYRTRWVPAMMSLDPGWPKFTALRTSGGTYTLDVHALMTYGSAPYYEHNNIPPTVTGTLEFRHFPHYYGVNTGIDIKTEGLPLDSYNMGCDWSQLPPASEWPKVGTITINGPSHGVTIT